MSVSENEFEFLRSLFSSVQLARGNVLSIDLNMSLNDLLEQYASNNIRFVYVQPKPSSSLSPLVAREVDEELNKERYKGDKNHG